jgi:hypothetical protein
MKMSALCWALNPLKILCVEINILIVGGKMEHKNINDGDLRPLSSYSNYLLVKELYLSRSELLSITSCLNVDKTQNQHNKQLMKENINFWIDEGIDRNKWGVDVKGFIVKVSACFEVCSAFYLVGVISGINCSAYTISVEFLTLKDCLFELVVPLESISNHQFFKEDLKWATPLLSATNVDISQMLRRRRHLTKFLGTFDNTFKSGTSLTSCNEFNEDIFDEVISECTVVSLLCPITLGRISIPVKGIRCKHAQCFDKKNFLQLNGSKSLLSNCPICGTLIKNPEKGGLVVDRLLFDVIKYAAERKINSTKVWMYPDNSWKIIEQENFYDETAKYFVNESTQDVIIIED